MRFRRKRRYTYYNSYTSSRRQRVRWDRVAVIGGIVAVIFVGVVLFNLNRIKLMFKGYSFSEQNIVLKLSKQDVKEILSHDKMNHIQDWIKTSEDVALYDEYERYLSINPDYKIKVVVETIDDIFDNYVNQMKALEYTDEQIWAVLKTADVDDIRYLIEKEYRYFDIQPFMKVKGFSLKNMEKYKEVYAKVNNYNYAVLVTTYPFIISTNKVDRTYTIQNPTEILNLVKKGFQFPASYEPKDLVKPDMPISPKCEGPLLRKEAANALIEMYKDASNLGYELVINSAYRSYDAQKKVYDEYFAKYDEVTAASLVAIPGASEHQTGLGVDLTSQSVIKGERLVFGDTIEYKWCKDNSYKYGFILRFEENKADITGIAKEPWHFRYVGKEAAKKIYENKWTFEEYCLYEGIIPNVK